MDQYFSSADQDGATPGGESAESWNQAQPGVSDAPTLASPTPWAAATPNSALPAWRPASEYTWRPATPDPFDSETPARMPKHAALAMVHQLRVSIGWVVAVLFLLLVGLVSQHVTGVTAAQGTTSSATSTSGNQSSNGTQNGGFFNTPSDGGGFFGANGGSSQAPITGSSVS